MEKTFTLWTRFTTMPVQSALTHPWPRAKLIISDKQICLRRAHSLTQWYYRSPLLVVAVYLRFKWGDLSIYTQCRKYTGRTFNGLMNTCNTQATTWSIRLDRAERFVSLTGDYILARHGTEKHWKTEKYWKTKKLL